MPVPVGPFVPYRPPQPLPAGTCAPPVGDWTGHASVYYRAQSGNYSRFRGDVTWTLASTTGCVDHYVPTGTVHIEHGYDCCHGYPGSVSKPLGPEDGELVVDRSTIPATFRMHGESHWDVAQSCPIDEHSLCLFDGPDLGGVWASVAGEIDGDVVGGSFGEGFPELFEWRLTRAGASLPATPCSAPVVDRWSAVTATPVGSAEVNWTRVSTVGCRDTYHPQGTAHFVPFPWGDCQPRSMAPADAAVGDGDGVLVIDRSTPVPNFTMVGYTTWPADAICRHADGTETTTSTTATVWWARELAGVVLGDRFSGSTSDGASTYRWAAHALP